MTKKRKLIILIISAVIVIFIATATALFYTNNSGIKITGSYHPEPQSYEITTNIETLKEAALVELGDFYFDKMQPINENLGRYTLECKVYITNNSNNNFHITETSIYVTTNSIAPNYVFFNDVSPFEDLHIEARETVLIEFEAFIYVSEEANKELIETYGNDIKNTDMYDLLATIQEDFYYSPSQFLTTEIFYAARDEKLVMNFKASDGSVDNFVIDYKFTEIVENSGWN